MLDPIYVLAMLFALTVVSIALVLFLLYEGGYYINVIFVALGIRLILLVYQESTKIFGNSDIGDYLHYYEDFVQVLSDGSVAGFIDFNVEFYTILYPGWIYFLFEQLWVIRLANSLVAVFVLIPLNSIHKSLFGSRIRAWQVAIILLWPSFLRLSVGVGRSVAAIFLTLVSIAIVLKWTENSTLRMAAALIISIFFVFMIRVHQAAYPIFVLGLIYLAGNIWRDFSFRTITVYSMLSLVIGGAYVVLNQHFAPSSHKIESLDRLAEMAQSTATGGSGYLHGIYPTSYFDLLWYLPLHGFYFLFSPMPWDVHNVLALGGSIESMFVLVITCVALWRKRSFVIRHWELLAVLGAIVLIVIGYGAVIKNAGRAVRYRTPAVFLLLIISTTLLTCDIGDFRNSD